MKPWKYLIPALIATPLLGVFLLKPLSCLSRKVEVTDPIAGRTSAPAQPGASRDRDSHDGQSTASLSGAGAKPSLPSATLANAPAGAPSASEPECFTVTLRHKDGSGHKDDETCSLHGNLIRLDRPGVNPKSICVRVDGTPVRFQTRKPKGKSGATELAIGAIAGPKATITATYCVGKSRCAEDCVVPRDEFMEAIGAEEAPGRHPVAHWDPNDATDDGDLSAELDAELQRELSGGGSLALYDGWAGTTAQAACQVTRSPAKALPAGRKTASR